MTTLYRAMQAITAIQKQLAAEEPEIAIRAAYELPPAGQNPETPCFVNEPTGLPQTSLGPSVRIRTYTIASRLLLGKVADHRDAYLEGLLALDEAWQNAFALNTHLGEGSINIKNLVGDDPWYDGWDWNGQRYIGLHYLFDLRIDDVPVIGVGAGA